MPLSQPCCDLWNSVCYRYSKCPWKTHAEVLQCLLFRDPITTAPITSPPVRHLHATYSRARSSRNYGLNKWYMWSMSGMPEECELLSTKPLQIPFLNPVLFPQAFWVWLHYLCSALLIVSSFVEDHLHFHPLGVVCMPKFQSSSNLHPPWGYNTSRLFPKITLTAVNENY